MNINVRRNAIIKVLIGLVKGNLVRDERDYDLIATKDYVYKLKKLPKSTIEELERLSVRECEVGKRMSTCYIKVLKIVERGQTMALVEMDNDNKETPLSYCIQLKRLNRDDRIDRVLASFYDRGGFAEIENTGFLIGRKINSYPPVINAVSTLASSDTLFAKLKNFKNMLHEEVDEQHLGDSYLKYSIALVTEFINNYTDLIDERGLNGFVRHSHGNLSFRNIYMRGFIVELVNPLDDNSLDIYRDVLSEISNLLVHLDVEYTADLSSLIIKGALSALNKSGEAEVPKLIFFYKALNALALASSTFKNIHGEDEWSQSHMLGLNEIKKLTKLSAINAKLALEPFVIVLCGTMGVGKTKIAKQLSEYGIKIISANALRAEITKKTPFELMSMKYNEEAFSDEITLEVYQKAGELAMTELKRGIPVLLNGSIIKQEFFDAFNEGLNGDDNRGIGITTILIENNSDDLLLSKLKRKRQDDKNTEDIFYKVKEDFTFDSFNKKISISENKIIETENILETILYGKIVRSDNTFEF